MGAIPPTAAQPLPQLADKAPQVPAAAAAAAAVAALRALLVMRGSSSSSSSSRPLCSALLYLRYHLRLASLLYG